MLNDVHNINLPSEDAPAEAPAKSQPVPHSATRLLLAAGDPARWALLRELAGGETLAVQDLAARIGRNHNQTSKHLAILRTAGAIAAVTLPESDGRKQFYAIPEAQRRNGADGQRQIDYGPCVLRFP